MIRIRDSDLELLWKVLVAIGKVKIVTIDRSVLSLFDVRELSTDI